MNKEDAEILKLRDVIISGLRGINPPYLTDRDNVSKIGLEVVVTVIGDLIEIHVVDESVKIAEPVPYVSLVTNGTAPFNWYIERDELRENLALLITFTYNIDNVIKKAVKDIKKDKFKPGVVIRPKAKDGKVIEAFSDCLILEVMPSETPDINDTSLRVVNVGCFYELNYDQRSEFKSYRNIKIIPISDALANWDIIESCVGVTV